MKSHGNHFVRSASRRGWTLVEMMIALLLATLLTAGVVALGMFTSKSFYLMGNYVDLDAQSRNAADVMSREIRNASALLSFTNNPEQLVLTNATSGYGVTITYYANNSTLVFTKTINGQAPQTLTLLTHCDSWTNQLLDRYPLITSTSISFYPATNSSGQLDPKFCKVIDMSWTCSRTMLGTKFSTEIVQTAEIVLRNQVKN